MAEILINNVKKSYGKTEVIHGASFKINDGELVVIVGPSGCGKSTLLRMIAGLEKITEGDISINGKIVNNLEESIDHINKYGSLHTDSIVTKNKKTAKKFLSSINSSIAIHNASTQFADGGEFGFGAEVGISTSKLHPRGPIGLDQLTTYKYILEGKGQIRK